MNILKLIMLITVNISFASTSQHMYTKQEFTVNVSNIKSNEGKILVGFYQNPKLFLKDEGLVISQAFDIPNNASDINTTFSSIQEGTYAIGVFQDLNNNGKLDVNFFGIPKEPYAFSNNTKPLFKAPSFEQCKFEIAENTPNKINIRLIH